MTSKYYIKNVIWCYIICCLFMLIILCIWHNHMQQLNYNLICIRVKICKNNQKLPAVPLWTPDVKSGYLCFVFFCRETYHLLIRQLAPLNAAAVPNGLLVPLSLNVAKQVDFRGDLKTQTQRSQVTRGGSAEEKAEGPRRTHPPHNTLCHHSRPDSSQVSRHMFRPFKAKYDPLILTDICKADRHIS